jgi:hypothetical protein
LFFYKQQVIFILFSSESQGLVDLVIGNVPGGVGVPMVFQSGVDIPKWNAKVSHYVDFVFIFANKFMSQIGAILFFPFVRLANFQID